MTSRPFLTFRAIALGLLGVVLLCGITPYNNLVLANTDLIGNHFPAGVLLLILLVVVGINAPLARFKPQWMLRRDEILVMLSMWLIASAIPFVGLNRYFPGQIVSYWYTSSERNDLAEVMETVDPPDWLFPTLEKNTAVERGREDVIRGYFERLPADRSTFLSRVYVVPWSKWTTPAITWGIFFGAVFGMGLFITMLWHRQWTNVERLPFPLANVYLSLIDTPPPGRWLSNELRSPRLWIAAGTVFFIHFFNGGMKYVDGVNTATQIPLSFTFYSIFADTPIRFAHWSFQAQTVFFTIIGLMFFVRSRIAFSLWFFYLLSNVWRISAGMQSMDVSEAMTIDQIMGAVTVLSIWIVFVARQTLWNAIRSFFKGTADPELRLERIYAALLLICLVTLVIWLKAVGVSLIGAVWITAALTAMYLVLARVISETGLLYVLLPIEPQRLWLYVVPTAPGATAGRTTLPTYFFSSAIGNLLCHDTRQALPGYASTASKLADEAGDAHPSSRQRLGLVALLFATILIAYLAGGASTLYVRYNYDTTLDSKGVMLDTGNNWGSLVMPRDRAMTWTRDYTPPGVGAADSHSRIGHFTLGATITAALGVMRARFAGWPLDPIGYLLCWTWGVQVIWFSIFLGWLAKQVTLYLGGGAAITRMRPAFIGLIMGETLAVVFWLVVSFIRAWLGMEYISIQILPA